MQQWVLYVNHLVSTKESIMTHATELSKLESLKACSLEVTLAWAQPATVYG